MPHDSAHQHGRIMPFDARESWGRGRESSGKAERYVNDDAVVQRFDAWQLDKNSRTRIQFVTFITTLTNFQVLECCVCQCGRYIGL